MAATEESPFSNSPLEQLDQLLDGGPTRQRAARTSGPRGWRSSMRLPSERSLDLSMVFGLQSDATRIGLRRAEEPRALGGHLGTRRSEIGFAISDRPRVERLARERCERLELAINRELPAGVEVAFARSGGAIITWGDRAIRAQGRIGPIATQLPFRFQFKSNSATLTVYDTNDEGTYPPLLTSHVRSIYPDGGDQFESEVDLVNCFMRLARGLMPVDVDVNEVDIPRLVEVVFAHARILSGGRP